MQALMVFSRQSKASEMFNFENSGAEIGKRRTKVIHPSPECLNWSSLRLTVVKLHETFCMSGFILNKCKYEWTAKPWMDTERIKHSFRARNSKIRLLVKNERITIERKAENRLENSSSQGESWNLISIGQVNKFSLWLAISTSLFTSTMTNWAEISQITERAEKRVLPNNNIRLLAVQMFAFAFFSLPRFSYGK